MKLGLVHLCVPLFLAACSAPLVDAPAEEIPAVAVVVVAETDLTAGAAPVHAQTPLGVALQRAITEGPSLAAARAREAVSVAAVTEAEGAWRPSISAGIDAGVSTASDPSLVPILRLSQQIFDGGVSEKEAAAARVRVAQAQAETRSQLARRALAAIRAWEELYLAQGLLTIAAEADARNQRFADQIALRLRAGVGRNADMLRVASRRAEAAALLASAQGRVRAAETRIIELFDVPLDPAPLPLAPPPVAGIDRNPALIALEAQERAARRARDAVMASRMPSVFLDVTARAPQNSDASVGAGLRLGYDFGSDGQRSAALASAEAQVAQAVADRELMARDLTRALADAQDRSATLAAELGAARNAAETSAAALADAEAQFAGGRVDILDLLELGSDVERTAARAQELASDARIAGYVVLYLTGELLEVFGICAEGCPA
ncbi:TolC family protein [Pseudogemmobacter sp. W21_MBD1_M6]|uniref:TolC family protein n=1 Tax=Pseudogemmobacter sp. W21_MBD1_M6 TaxID=3240271 RepID=UPI003F9C4E5F